MNKQKGLALARSVESSPAEIKGRACRHRANGEMEVVAEHAETVLVAFNIPVK